VTGVADAQTIALSLTGLTDTAGRTMLDTSLRIGFLLGDAAGDSFVNVGDTIVVRSRSGQAADVTKFNSDINADGSINSTDANHCPKPIWHCDRPTAASKSNGGQVAKRTRACLQ
jgi:hypothetical protein